MTYTYRVQFYEGSHMPKGIYKRKGRKAKPGRKVFLASKDTMAAIRMLDRASEPKQEVYVVEILQKRRVAIYVKADGVPEATFLANEFIHRNKKIGGEVVMPGVGITQLNCEIRGVGIGSEVYFDPESRFAKAFESPIQKVWSKRRAKKKSSDFVDAPQTQSYKILPVRAK